MQRPRAPTPGARRSFCRATLPIVPTFSLALVAAIFVVPPASVIGVWIWARRMSRRPELPRFASMVAYGLVILSALAIVAGSVVGLVVGRGMITSERPGQKARGLAEGLSEAMNGSALGLSVAGLAALWLLFCAWQWAPMSSTARTLVVAVGGALVGFFAYQAGADRQGIEDRRDRDATIAFRWGDGKYGEAFYGMHVFEVRTASGVDVRATIEIGPGNPMWHDCGQIGRAESHEEAARRFSVISWRPDGVHVGSDMREEYFLDRATIEAHR